MTKTSRTLSLPPHRHHAYRPSRLPLLSPRIDIEEWEAATEVPEEDDLQDLDEGMEDDVDEEMEDDVDEEMEDVPQEDIDDIMYNTEECADHAANDADVSYMTMFAPDLLLTRYNLGHLV
jgi:hypothetical protein